MKKEKKKKIVKTEKETKKNEERKEKPVKTLKETKKTGEKTKGKKTRAERTTT